MEAKTLALAAAGAIALAAFTLISYLFRDTAVIWVETRALGLAAYMFLFLSVAAGEWRMLTKGKSQFTLFRYHHTVSILAVFLTIAHLMTTILDNYKWGPKLSLPQILGLSFSDKWLAFLSLGTLGLYAMLIIGATSGPKAIRLIGFSRWKLIHYLGYAAFYMGYVHAMNLGTDMKSPTLSWVLQPIALLTLAIVSGLLILRVLEGTLKLLGDQLEVSLAAFLLVGLCLVTTILLDIALKGAASKELSIIIP